jgi:pyruvate dehydrogenase (quinone)
VCLTSRPVVAQKLSNEEILVSRNVADILCEMLANAGVKRCYGIVGDALNPFIDALRRNGRIDFIHVRHEM